MMQPRLILSLLLSLVAINFSYGQNEQEKIDSVAPVKNPNHLYVGLDIATPAMALFSDKQGAQGFVSYQFKPKWVAIAELGYGKNKFTENHWDIDVDGIYGKIGANWFISQDKENAANGFYLGGRLAFTSFNQNIKQYPIRDIYNNEIIGYDSLGKESVNAFWVEMVIGGRLELYKKLYADFSLHPAIFIGGKKQQNIEAIVVPGYGRNNGPFNLPIFWGISYQFF